MGSVYLRTGMGRRGLHLELPDQFGEVSRAYGRPFISGGDSQLPAEQLVESGWLGDLRAEVVSDAKNWTCQLGTRRPRVDYFVISRSIRLFAGSCFSATWSARARAPAGQSFFGYVASPEM